MKLTKKHDKQKIANRPVPEVMIIKLSEMEIVFLGELLRSDPSEIKNIRSTINPLKRILLLINSIGGDCSTGYSVIELVLGHKNVTGLVLGLCDSMAIPVFQACQVRLATPRATFLFHSLETEITVKNLDAENDDWIEEQRRDLAREQERYYQHVMRQTGDNLNREILHSWCKEEIRILADKALKHGLIDQIIDWDIDNETFDLTTVPAG